MVDIDQAEPIDALLEQRIRSAATLTSSHSGLRFMLEVELGRSWDVTVGETVEGVTPVELRKHVP